MLTENLGNPRDVDAVIISHAHSDHISYYPLRVLEEYGHKVRIHESCIEQLKEKHFNGYGFGSLKLKPFGSRKFTVGDMVFEPFEVPHNPYYPTYGFVVEHEGTRSVIATDFNRWEGAMGYFADAAFIFVESNHDIELLRLHFNPNSEFHMSNPETSRLLCTVRRESQKPPKTVMLGHISSQRNKPAIAIKEVGAAFRRQGLRADFELCTAPLYECSKTVRIR